MIAPSILLVHLLPGLLAQAPPTVPPDPFDFWPLVTPLLGVSQPCFEASLDYANGILNGSSWAIQMLDSSGHLPFLQEGQLSDTRPLYICAILDALLGPGACPPSLQDYPLMIPFGHAVDLGDQDLCTTVTEVTTHFCHNGLNAFPSEATVRNAKEFRPNAPQHRLHTLDGEHILRVRQQAIKKILRNQVDNSTAAFNSSSSSSSPHGLSPFPFSDLLQRNPVMDKMIHETREALSEINKAICPGCRATFNFGQLAMTWVILWWFNNMGNGGGAFPIGGGWPWPAYRGCYPAACTKQDVMSNSIQLDQLYGIPGLKMLGIVGFSEEDMAESGLAYDPLPGCSSDERYQQNWTNGNYIAVAVFSTLGLLLLAGTVYDVYSRQTRGSNLPEKAVENVDHRNKYILSFSILQNLEFVLSTKGGGSDRLDCIEGIRAISMTWVVLGHSFLFSSYYLYVDNKADTPLDSTEIGGLGFRAILAGPYSVDSFFFIGSTLVSYLLLKDLDKTHGWGNMTGLIHMVFLYVNRILRISVPYAVYILYVAGIQNLLFKEPLDVGTYTEQMAIECREHWAADLLYVNVFNSEGQARCVGQGWFLGTDMWFFVFAPIIVYPLWLSKFNSVYKVAAYTWWLVFLSLSVAWCLRCTFQYSNWTPGDIPCWMDVVQSQDFAVYGRRNQCYIVGLLLGHFLHITKGKKINIPPVVNLVIWEGVLLLFFALVYAPYDTYLERVDSNKPIARFWYACSHLMWGLCLAWLVFACCRGLGGVVNDFLTWNGWRPIAKISFMTYLVHLDVQFIFFSLQVICKSILLKLLHYPPELHGGLDVLAKHRDVFGKLGSCFATRLLHFSCLGTTLGKDSETGDRVVHRSVVQETFSKMDSGCSDNPCGSSACYDCQYVETLGSRPRRQLLLNCRLGSCMLCLTKNPLVHTIL